MSLDDGRSHPLEGAPVAVVTGGSRGIGAATSRLLASRGWRVVVGFASDRASAEAVLADCPGGAISGGDVSDPAALQQLFATADALGPLHTLVINAAIGGAAARVDELDDDRVRRMFEVNVVAAFACAREAVRRMSTRHGGAGGSIVCVSSGAALRGSPGEYVDYAASKGALETLAHGLAREVATEGVRVNIVRPGLTLTDFHDRFGRPGRLEAIAPTIPMERAGTPEEVAAGIAWLCSPEASYVTGTALDVAGGR